MDEARLSRLRGELTKARRKRDEWETKVKDLERRYKEAENTCIHEMVHAASLSPEQLAELIRAASTGMIRGLPAAAREEEPGETAEEGPENEDEYEKQNEMIEKAISNKVDAIVLSAINYYKSVDSVEKAVRKGIKVVTIDSDVGSQQVSMFIGTDNVAAGKQAGAAAQNSRKKNEKLYIGLVNYDAATDNGFKREQGFRDYIANVDNAEIVGAINVQSDVISAEQGTVQMLKEHPEINVLVGFNELMTLGIGNAMKNLSLSGKISAIGFDTNVESVGMLETGEMSALIVQNPFAIGYLGVKNAADIVNGKLPSNERLDETTNVITVTKDNMFNDDVQKVMFHFQ